MRPLGFSLESRQVKRAGLDYWHRVPLRVWDDFDDFLAGMHPRESEMALLTKGGLHPYWKVPRAARLFLIFGSETDGLPESILARYRQSSFYIPIRTEIRCLNLSTAVGIALYESLRPTLSL